MQESARQTPKAIEFTPREAEALAEAREAGWLTVNRAIGEGALAQWQFECERYGRPFAVVRQEPSRNSIWFVLAAGRAWSERERSLAGHVLSSTQGFILSENSLRAFTGPDDAGRLMRRLLALTAH
ncbi:MAG TPA: hypothetical protein VFB15_02500 [Candidatus Binataceae bacterium]|jgi:hypothetical protein|nr:hypothetical protein [Candidatus Binataceae bacterium]